MFEYLEYIHYFDLLVVYILFVTTLFHKIIISTFTERSATAAKVKKSIEISASVSITAESEHHIDGFLASLVCVPAQTLSRIFKYFCLMCYNIYGRLMCCVKFLLWNNAIVRVFKVFFK